MASPSVSGPSKPPQIHATSRPPLQLAPAPVASPSLRPVQPSSLVGAQSSQARNWRFTPSQIHAMRRRAYEEAAAELERSWKEEEALGSDLSIPSPSSYPSLSELELLTQFYLFKLRGLVRALGMPEMVEETAAAYLKRYFLRKSELTVGVKDVMLTALFLATKTTSQPLSLSHFARRIAGKAATPEVVAENEQTVRGHEFGLADAIDWELSVQLCSRALRGLGLELQSLDPSPSISELHSILSRAHALLKRARLHPTLEFLYTPPQIALACVLASGDKGKELGQRWVDEMERRKGEEEKRRLEEREGWRGKVGEKAFGKEAVEAAEGTAKEASDTASPAPTSVLASQARPKTVGSVGLSQILDAIVGIIDEMQRETKEVQAKAGLEGAAAIAQPPLDMERVKDVDRRLKECADPRGKKGSKLYERAQSALETEDASKRAAKASAVTGQRGGDKDPFGSTEVLPSSTNKRKKDPLDSDDELEGNGRETKKKGGLELGAPLGL